MSCDPSVSVDARAEQAWNDSVLGSAVDAPAWRLWRYDRPAVVLGRAQRGLDGTAAGPAIEIVDRQAGGGAVLVGPWMLSLSIVLPPDHPLVAGRSVAASYAEIGAALVNVLAAHGVPANAATAASARKASPALAWACFAGVTVHEVLVDGRKIVGFAQRRQRTGTLVVGGLLVDPVPWATLVAAVRPMLAARDGPDAVAVDEGVLVRALAAETVSVAEVLGRAVPVDALARGIAAELEPLLGDGRTGRR